MRLDGAAVVRKIARVCDDHGDAPTTAYELAETPYDALRIARRIAPVSRLSLLDLYEALLEDVPGAPTALADDAPTRRTG